MRTWVPVVLAMILSVASLMQTGCATMRRWTGSEKAAADNRFADDVKFLENHTKVITLREPAGNAQIALAPALQGRVMTSTADGKSSFGWINRQYFDDVAAGSRNPHISPYGGEDRFWIGPEGGQFSIFFAKADPFDLEHWFTPKFIDVEAFETEATAADQATFHRRVSFENYTGTPFDIDIRRTVRLLTADAAWQKLKLSPMPGVNVVAFETENALVNKGQDWSKQSGLLSIWILGMFNASPTTTVVIPIQPGPETTMGPPVNDDYFGKVPPERLKVADGVVYFKGDANYRSKIGIPPVRTKPIMGSYDPEHKVLTLVQFTFDSSNKDYVNSAWKMQDNPFGGDVANSYNDGPPPTGKPQLGKFYELESSSPAKELKAGQALQHVHRTFHLQGPEASLDQVARSVLGVSLDQVKKAFAQ